MQGVRDRLALKSDRVFLETELSRWLESLIGRGRQFPSARHLSLRAGLNQSTVNTILEKGKASPETLLQLAAATGTPARRLFAMAGWLPEDEAEGGLTAEQRELAEIWEGLDPEARAVLLVQARALRGLRGSPGQGPLRERREHEGGPQPPEEAAAAK